MINMKYITKIISAIAILWAVAIAHANAQTQTAILAGGCFWCIEKDMENVEGVIEVDSGYIGGKNGDINYENYAKLGHREAVRVKFDETKISYEKLLNIFWRTIDPTDKDGQFCDRGQSYTSAIYALDAKQKEIAIESKIQNQKELGQKFATPIEPNSTFFPSEPYHQNYYKKKPIRYAFYRNRCKRDKTVKEIWGEQAYKGVKGK